ncbi:precorrin-3B synthase [Haloechinothrix sp. LS1_15]|uniref:precorrin-3B synthase n=1 Tax=Haloechinothrix sp. LS1_15 TaxID=2652248 RepID=UPI002944D841|nr:precorrin-3B synthase [Haloechinothrix sp. LS1_15]MDV6013739.1 precorrin-3B synthase [Haloechinothrix sp. LS1_15]
MPDPYPAPWAGTAHRERPDACPGALTTHDAADGRLARVRVPGGKLAAGQLVELAACAEELGDGVLHLTSRGNVQLRGLAQAMLGELADRLAEAGLLPSPSHERVRNILASPVSGLTGGVADVRALVGELDRAVCARAELAGLPGRFLFGLDDGRGDIAGDRIDVCWRAVTPDTGAVLLAGADTGLRVRTGDAVAALVAAAVAFASSRGDAWQVRELVTGGGAWGSLVDAVAAEVTCHPQAPCSFTPGGELALGGHRQDDARGERWCVVAGVPLGALPSAAARSLATEAPRLVITPWRSVVLPDLEATAAASVTRRLAADGLLVSDGEPRHRVTACIGAPGCDKARADVRADVSELIRTAGGALAGTAAAAHFSGCERRCGKPWAAGTTVVDVLAAEEGGYRVDGRWVPTVTLAASLARAMGDGRNSTDSREGRRS